MKKLLILNGSHSDIQLIKAGKKLGFYVITTGNNSKLIGHKYSDEYHSADFSNPDEILELAKRLKIDAICSCANDFGALAASYAAEKLDLKGHDKYETALTLHHKDKFKIFSKENDILTPIADNYDGIAEALKNKDKYELPVIIKPVDLTGGKGVTKVFKDNEYEEAVHKAFTTSKVGKFIIEPYISGTYHSFSTFVVNKKVTAYFSDNEYSYLNPFLVVTSAGPADNIKGIENILLEESNRIIERLNLVDGVFHIQYVMQDNKPCIIEITRRCSGDWYSEPVKQALGIDWAKWIVKAETGMDCAKFPKNIIQKGFYGRHCIMGYKNGIVKNVEISEKLRENVYDSFIWWKPKDKITNYMVDKLGILFLNYRTREEMISKVERINDLVRVVYY